jgi:hypothetical protein
MFLINIVLGTAGLALAWKVLPRARGAQAVAVLNHLEQVGGPGGRERLQREIVEDEHVDLGPGRHEPRQPAVGASQDELVE